MTSDTLSCKMVTGCHMKRSYTMPTERFLNLPQEKRQRICQAAYEEMARVPYDKLSINKIIQRAEIPRGSFYQYFRDKEDLLEFMMRGFKECMKESIRKALRESNGDIFYVFVEVLTQMLAMCDREEHWQILRNVFSGLPVGQIRSFEVFQSFDEDFLRDIYPLIDKSRLRSDDWESFLELEELLSLLVRNAGAEIFDDIKKKDQVLEKVRRRLEIIKYGVLKEEECSANV